MEAFKVLRDRLTRLEMIAGRLESHLQGLEKEFESLKKLVYNVYDRE